MGFFDELTKLFTSEEIDSSFHIECLGKTALCVSGYKKIVSFSESEVVLKVNNKMTIKIIGCKLYAKKIETSEVVIAGIIMNILFEEV